MEVKDILTALDIKAEDIDGFKKAINEKFIPKSQAMDDDEIKGKITGKITGAFTTNAKRVFGLSNEDVKDKKWEDILELGVQKQNERIKELEDLASANNGEKEKELTSKLEKAAKKADEYKNLLETASQTLAQKETEFTSTIKGMKVSSFFDKAKEKVSSKLKSDISEAERFYLDSKLKENIIVDFDDNGEPLVLGKDGKRLTNPNKVGAFFSLEEAIEKEAETLNLIKKNNGQVIDPKKIFTPIEQKAQIQQTNTRTIHPNALKNAEVLRSQK